MERAWVAHAVGAVDKYPRLAEIFLGPVHPEAERISLMVDQAEPLASQQRSGMSHCGNPFRLCRQNLASIAAASSAPGA
jgi:hypothetical protein